MSSYLSSYSSRRVSLSVVAASCVALLALNAPAHSRPTQNTKPQVAQKHKAKKPAVAQPREAVRDLHSLRAPTREQASMFSSTMSTSALISEARKYMGTNPTARKKLWCATFMNFVLAKTGYAGTGSDAAKSFASYGKRVSEPRVGAIAVLTRGKRGGHVGIVTGIDQQGNPIIISGNHNKRVGEARYSRNRVIAYVMPTDAQAAPGGATRLASVESDGGGMSSPIAELLAAINAERDRRNAQPQQQNQRVAQPVPPQPVPQQRVVQQTATQGGIDPRRPPLDPALATFLGLRDTERERPAPRAQNGAHNQVASDRHRTERVFYAR